MTTSSKKPAAKSAAKGKNAAMAEDKPESADTLPALLTRMSQLAGSLGNEVVLSPIKGKTLLTGTASGLAVEARFPQAIPGLTEARGFPVGSLQDAVAKRQKLALSVNDFTLTAKNDSYSAQIIGVEVTGVVRAEAPAEPTTEVQFSADLLLLMKEAMTAVSIQKTLEALPDITIHFSFRKKSVVVAAFDRSQMAFFTAANPTGQVFELTLPLPKAEGLMKNLQPGAELKANADMVWVKSLGITFSSSLPSEDQSHGIPVDRVIARAKELSDTSLPNRVAFRKEDLVAFLANTGSIRKSSALLRVNVSADGKSTLELSADGNVVKSKLATKNKKAFKFLLDINYVQALVSKSEEYVELELDDSSLIFKSEKIIYASMLSAEPVSAAAQEDSDEE